MPNSTHATETASEERQTLINEVDPARLADGEWCYRRHKTVGKGDISASYSADRIGMDQPVRKPFDWQGATWLCVGLRPHRGVYSANAYRLVDPSVFEGTPTTYREKLRDAEAARADPNGFYHGMVITHAKQDMVLCGPPALFVPVNPSSLRCSSGRSTRRSSLLGSA